MPKRLGRAVARRRADVGLLVTKGLLIAFLRGLGNRFLAIHSLDFACLLRSPGLPVAVTTLGCTRALATEASAKADAVDAPVPWCSDFRPGLDANVK